MSRNAFILSKILRVRPKAVIHIGAHHGQDKSNYKLLGSKEIYWGEPNPNAMRVLLKRFPEDHFISKPFWNKPDETITFYLSEHSEQSSLIEPLNQDMYRELSLTSTTLDKEFSNLKSSIKLMLVIDVQGAEIEVLLGGLELLRKVKYVVVEIANRNQGYKKTPSKSEIVTILEKYSFRQILQRPAFDNSYADVLYMKTSVINGKLITQIDSIVLKIMMVRHVLKYKHRPRDAFHCESCNV